MEDLVDLVDSALAEVLVDQGEDPAIALQVQVDSVVHLEGPSYQATALEVQAVVGQAQALVVMEEALDSADPLQVDQ